MQPKTQSLIETLCNVATGFIVSLTYWQIAIIPQIEGKELTFDLNMSVTLQFTALSILRGYLWRRYFNGLLTRKLTAKPS